MHRRALCSIPGTALAATIALTSLERPAHGQALEQVQTQAQAQAEAPAEEKKQKRNLLIVPIPLSDPANGSGVAVGAVMFYNPRGEPQQWVTGGGIVYTSRGTKGIGGFHSMSLQQDRFRMKVIAAYVEGPMRYFGVGEAAGDAGTSVEFDNKQPHLQVQGQIRAIEHGYVGVRYSYSHYNLTLGEDEMPGIPLPPDDQLKSTLSMVGPTLSYDTRDSSLQPRAGMFLSGTWMVGMKALGNSFSHSKLQLSGNFYLSTNSATTVALRGATCVTTGEVPFYDLCSFGSGADIRGYESGRFRDRTSWALQGELRRRLSSRFGGVAFVGIGGIAPSPGEVVGEGNFLPAAGLGVRYRPFRNNDVNLRADVAMGLYGPAVYVGISEAF